MFKCTYKCTFVCVSMYAHTSGVTYICMCISVDTYPFSGGNFSVEPVRCLRKKQSFTLCGKPRTHVEALGIHIETAPFHPQVNVDMFISGGVPGLQKKQSFPFRGIITQSANIEQGGEGGYATNNNMQRCCDGRWVWPEHGNSVFSQTPDINPYKCVPGMISGHGT